MIPNGKRLKEWNLLFQSKKKKEEPIDVVDGGDADYDDGDDYDEIWMMIENETMTKFKKSVLVE